MANREKQRKQAFLYLCEAVYGHGEQGLGMQLLVSFNFHDVLSLFHFSLE